MRVKRSICMLVAPVAGSMVPLASLLNRFTRQVGAAPPAIGNGGPKKHCASAAQAATLLMGLFVQSASTVHALGAPWSRVPSTQCLLVVTPCVQVSAGPALAARK